MDTNIFPITQERHIIFVIIACIFFILQFVRTKHVYQLIVAAAIPLSLLIYLDPANQVLFYGTGILEAVLLLAALIASIVQSRMAARKAKQSDAPKPAEG